MGQHNRYRGPPAAWLNLWERDFTAMGDSDKGSTPGAITIGPDAAVLVNPSSNFLKPTTGGVSLISGAAGGLQFDTTGCTTGPNNDLNHSLGAGVYWSISAVLAAAYASLWPNSQPGPEKHFSELALQAVVDVSEVGTNGEGVAVGLAASTAFSNGASAGIVKVAGAVNVIQDLESSVAFVSTGSTQALAGLPSQPDSLMVLASPMGGGAYWGISPGGVAYPTAWYTRDQFITCAVLNGPNTAGGVIRNTSVIFASVYDTGKTAIKTRVKKMTLWGRNPAFRFPGADSSVVAAAA